MLERGRLARAVQAEHRETRRSAVTARARCPRSVRELGTRASRPPGPGGTPSNAALSRDCAGILPALRAGTRNARVSPARSKGNTEKRCAQPRLRGQDARAPCGNSERGRLARVAQGNTEKRCAQPRLRGQDARAPTRPPRLRGQDARAPTRPPRPRGHLARAPNTALPLRLIWDNLR